MKRKTDAWAPKYATIRGGEGTISQENVKYDGLGYVMEEGDKIFKFECRCEAEDTLCVLRFIGIPVMSPTPTYCPFDKKKCAWVQMKDAVSED